MKNRTRICRMTAFACVALSVFAGVAPSLLAQPVMTADTGVPGAPFSEEELADLSAQEAHADGLEEIASGSALALVGLAAVVYLIWYYLDRN